MFRSARRRWMILPLALALPCALGLPLSVFAGGSAPPGVLPGKNGADFQNAPVTRDNIGAAPSSVVARAPTTAWDKAHGYIAGSECSWSAAFQCSIARLSSGELRILNDDTIGAAAWSSAEKVGSQVVEHSNVRPFDVGTWLVCYANFVARTSYLGDTNRYWIHAVGTDGTNAEIAFLADGRADWPTFDAFALAHGPTVFAAWYNQCPSGTSDAYDQSLNGAGTPDYRVLTTNAPNSAEAALNFASTSSCVTPAGRPLIGLYVYTNDPNNTQFNGLRVTGCTSTTLTVATFDGDQSLALASGTKVMLTTAMVIPPNNSGNVGNVRALMADQPYDIRKTYNQQLNLPTFAGGAIASNNKDVLFSFRCASYGNCSFYSLVGDGGSNHGEYFYSQHWTALHKSNGSNTWADAPISLSGGTNGSGASRGTTSAAIGGVHVDANNRVTAFLGEQNAVPNNSGIGSDALNGGSIAGGAVPGNNPSLSGGVAFGLFGIASPKLSDADYARARAALVKWEDLNPQVVDPHIVFIEAGYHYQTSSTNTYLQDVPWHLANAEPGWRVSGGPSATTPNLGASSITCKFAVPANLTITTTAQINPRVTNSIAVVGASSNDYGNTNPGQNGAVTATLSGGSLSALAVSNAGTGGTYMPGTYQLFPQPASGIQPTTGLLYTIGSDGRVASMSGSGGSGMVDGTYKMLFPWGGITGADGTYTVASGAIASAAYSVTAAGSGGTPGVYPIVLSGIPSTGTVPSPPPTYTVNSNGQIASAQFTAAGSGITSNTVWTPNYQADSNILNACHDTIIASLRAAGFTNVVVIFAPQTSVFGPAGDSYRKVAQTHIKSIAGMQNLATATPKTGSKGIYYLDANDLAIFAPGWNADLTLTNPGQFDLTSRALGAWAGQLDHGLRKLVGPSGL